MEDSKIIKNKKNTKIIYIIVLILVVVLVGVVYFIFTKKTEKDNNVPVENTIFTSAYKKLDFKEDKKLKRLYCSKTNTNEQSQVNDTEYSILYFDDNNEIQTYLFHDYIKLTDEYMNFYDEMYDNYKESLDNDYKYSNVVTDITKGEKEILVTVLTKKSDDKNTLGLPNYVSYEAAKQEKISEGFTCD